jgi:uncharacterized membrane protein affecting hemolysin expression
LGRSVIVVVVVVVVVVLAQCTYIISKDKKPAQNQGPHVLLPCVTYAVSHLMFVTDVLLQMTTPRGSGTQFLLRSHNPYKHFYFL